MGQATSLTAEEIRRIEAASVVGAKIQNGTLVLIKPGGVEVSVGTVGGGGAGGGSVERVIVTSPSQTRPDVDFVMWVGGTTRPNNMRVGDMWFSEGPPVPQAPQINTTSMNAMVVGAAFSQTLNVSGDSPISYSVTSGSLPDGLSLNSSSGTISGNPTSAGSYSFTVTATNDVGSDSQEYSGSVTASGTEPTITTSSIGSMTQNVAYSQTIVATGSTPITWGISGGSLPAGLTINTSTGVISGTPTSSGSYSFTVQAANAFGQNTRTYTGTVSSNVIAPNITTTSLGTLTQGSTVSIQIVVTGSNPISFAISSGSLPAGLSLNPSTGQIYGTPTGTGSYNFTIRATNSAGNDTQSYSGNISAPSVTPPNITTTSLNAMTVGSSFSQRIYATGGTPITFSVLSGNLPDGIALDSNTGELSGIPTEDGSYTFVIRATNSGGTDDQSYSGSVNPEASAISIFGSEPLTGVISLDDADVGSWLAHQYYVPYSQPSADDL